MAKDSSNSKSNKKEKRELGSTTSLGKRRSLASSGKKPKSRSPKSNSDGNNQQQDRREHHQQQHMSNESSKQTGSPRNDGNDMSDYGSQANAFRVPERKPSDPLVKVTILGGAGGIGQPLALTLMLHSEYIQHVALYDLSNQVKGVALDLSHIDRQCKVTGHQGPDELADAVRDASVIVCLAGIAQKPGMSRDDLFGTNAKIMFDLAKVCATTNPKASLAIVSNPVNSLIPLVCQVYQRILSQEPNQQASSPKEQTKPESPKAADHQHHNQQQGHPEPSMTSFHESSRRIYGVTTLDVVRASTLTAKSEFFPTGNAKLFKDPSKISVPVVGGHAGKTIIPLLSRATPKLNRKLLTEDKHALPRLVEAIQEAGIEVLSAKKGGGSATLATAYATCRLVISLLRAQMGETNVVECAYVRHGKPVMKDLDYFALPLVLGKDGYAKVGNILGQKLLPVEEQMLEECSKLLRANVAKGEDFAREQMQLEKNS